MNSNKKTAWQRAAIALLIASMLLSLSGCGKTAELNNYRGKLNTLLPEIVSTADSFQSEVNTLDSLLVSKDKTAYEAALTDLQTYAQTLIDDYHALANVTAPDEYSEQQKQMKTYADDVELMISDCVRMYTLMEESITSYLTDDTVAQIGRLQTEMEALTASSAAFDNLLNEVLGIDEESSDAAESTDAADSAAESSGNSK